MIDAFIQDVDYAYRILRKRPGFLVVAVLTVALGIGAATATFSVVDGVVVRALPYRSPGQLAYIWAVIPKWRQEPTMAPLWNRFTIRYSQYEQLQKRNSVFQDLGVLRGGSASIVGRGEPHRVDTGIVSASFFTTLGIQASFGRLFEAADEKADSNPTVVLSAALWQRDFDANPTALGETIVLDRASGRQSFTIIGILPDNVTLPVQGQGNSTPVPELFLPVPLLTDGDFEMIGRIRPNISTPDAERETANILTDALPPEFRQGGIDKEDSRFVGLKEQEIGSSKTPLLILFGAAGLLLLIACCNVANLFLGEAAKRQHEMTLRAALGASWSRITRQLITESVLISLSGGLIGMLFAAWGVRILILLAPTELPRLNEIGIHIRVLSFSIVVSVLTGLVFGVTPALGLARSNLNDRLKKDATNRGSQRRQLQAFVLVAEIAFSFVLLVGAALLTRSLLRINAMESGLRPENLISVQLAPLPESRYSSPSAVSTFYQQAISRLESLPSVKAVSVISMSPFGGGQVIGTIRIEGKEGLSGQPVPFAEPRHILANYFFTVGTPIMDGRTFTEAENANNSPVAIVNSTMAKMLWPGESPINKRIRWSDRWLSILGVNGDVREHGLAKKPVPTWYSPAAQYDDDGMASIWTLLVRTVDDPLRIGPDIRRAIWKVDPDLPIQRLATMSDLISISVANERYRTILITAFATGAGFLALIGLYGVVSRFVTYRNQEWAIRIALGARGSAVAWLVVRESFLLTAVGIAIGVPCAIAMRQTLSGLLFGISVLNLSTYVAVAFGLIAITLLTSYLPAIRASRVDPIDALRCE
jgi:putative ABC transport system permease protein